MNELKKLFENLEIKNDKKEVCNIDVAKIILTYNMNHYNKL